MSKPVEVVLRGKEAWDWLHQKPNMRRGPHNFRKMFKRLHWPVCSHCGLMLLKNKATELAARKQCEWEVE